MSLRDKKKLIIILKGFIKQPVIKQSPAFLSFSFLIDCCMIVFFSSLMKALIDFEKLIRFYQKKWRQFEKTDRNILPKTYTF